MAAEEYWEKSGEAFNTVFRRQARLGLELKQSADVFLTDAQFAQMLEMPVTKAKFRKSILYNTYYERKNRENVSTDPIAHLPVAIGMLNLVNDTPGWGREIRLEPLEGGTYFHLDLSGSPYTMFSPPQYTGAGFVSILKPLKLKSIDVSNTGIRDFSELRRLRTLDTLIACNVTIYDEQEAVNRLANLDLENLVVSEGMFSEKYIRKLRKSIGNVSVQQLDQPTPDTH